MFENMHTEKAFLYCLIGSKVEMFTGYVAMDDGITDSETGAYFLTEHYSMVNGQDVSRESGESYHGYVWYHQPVNNSVALEAMGKEYRNDIKNYIIGLRLQKEKLRKVECLLKAEEA